MKSFFFFSGLRGVERAESEGEASERHIREASLFKHLRHFLGLRERLHGGGEVGVGFSIAGDESPEERHEESGVDGKELFHGETRWRRQFQRHESASGTQHAAHLFQSSVEVFIVSKTVGDGESVKSFVGEGE